MLILSLIAAFRVLSIPNFSNSIDLSLSTSVRVNESVYNVHNRLVYGSYPRLPISKGNWWKEFSDVNWKNLECLPSVFRQSRHRIKSGKVGQSKGLNIIGFSS